MRRLSAILVAILISSSVESAGALGFGPYFEYGRVVDGWASDSGFDFDYDENHFGAGLSLDTSVTDRRLFNYRLDLGYQRVAQDFDHGGSIDGDGLVIDNAFGFRLLRNEKVRLWLGPAVRLSFDFFESHGVDAFYFGIGAGPVIGLNVHTGDLVSLAFTTGYQLSYVHGDYDGGDANGYEQLIFFKLHTFFRFNGD